MACSLRSVLRLPWSSLNWERQFGLCGSEPTDRRNSKNFHACPGPIIIMVSSKPSSSKKAKVSDSASKKVKGENFYHNAKTAGRLKMMKGGKPVYDRKGKMIQAAAFQKGEDETTLGRVQPDRRWFGRLWSLGAPPLAIRLISRGRKHQSYNSNRSGSLPNEPFGETKRPVLRPPPTQQTPDGLTRRCFKLQPAEGACGRCPCT